MSRDIHQAVQEVAPEFDSKIIPVMREAIVMVQMALFRRLKDVVRQRYQDWPDQEKSWLAGAVVNNLYGTEAADPQVNVFARNHRQLIEEELWKLHISVAELIPHITDSLRMQTLCDNHEGIHSIPCLLIARELGLLDEKRTLPLPTAFMIAIRQLGAEHGLIERMKTALPSIG